MTVNINKTKEEHHELMQKAVRWTYGVCSRGVGSDSVLVARSRYMRNVVVV